MPADIGVVSYARSREQKSKEDGGCRMQGSDQIGQSGEEFLTLRREGAKKDLNRKA
jgi:hypothetical protein